MGIFGFKKSSQLILDICSYRRIIKLNKAYVHNGKELMICVDGCPVKTLDYNTNVTARIKKSSI